MSSSIVRYAKLSAGAQFCARCGVTETGFYGISVIGRGFFDAVLRLCLRVLPIAGCDSIIFGMVRAIGRSDGSMGVVQYEDKVHNKL
ncbi:hypothetical protein R1sor_009075 [Riccia sorocarpa]|uniref:Uncharacterized protein n=1 Tax=Riccia sorocarpa TaxID=122646 RepID=A0ABD3H8Q5_9MARC